MEEPVVEAGTIGEEGVIPTSEEARDPENVFKKLQEEEDIKPKGPAEVQVEGNDSSSFIQELQDYFKEKDMEFKIPKFYGVEVDLYKLWTVVSSLGGYEKVTLGKLWRVVGDHFDPPKSCTTLSWSFRGFYEKALLDYEKAVGVGHGVETSPVAIGAPLASIRGGSSDAKSPLPDPNAKLVKRPATSTSIGLGLRTDKLPDGNLSADEKEGQTTLSGGGTAKRQRRLLDGEEQADPEGLIAVTSPGGLAVGLVKPDDGGRPRRAAALAVGEKTQQATQSRSSLRKGPHANGRENAPGRGKGEEPAAVVSDEGPPADWVRINVRRSPDCFEIYALVPGLLREEVRVQCEGGGKLVIAGEPEQPENPWGVTPFKKVILLPNCINAHETSAVVTLHGQLYVRAPIAQSRDSLEVSPGDAEEPKALPQVPLP